MALELEPEAPALGTSNPSLFSLFRNLNFVKFWLGQVVSYLGDRIDQMALLALVNFHVQDADVKSAHSQNITVAATLPYVLLSPMIGGIIDRFDRRRLLILLDVIRAVLILGVAVLMGSGHPNPMAIYAVVFGVGCATAVFLPAKSAFLPEIVNENMLLRANSVSATMGTLMTLVGTVIGGWLVKNFAWRVSLFVDVATYLVSALLLWMIIRPRFEGVVARTRGVQLKQEGGYFANLAAGFKFALTNRLTLACIVLNFWFFGVGGMFYSGLNDVAYTRIVTAIVSQANSSEVTAEKVEPMVLAWMFGALGLGLAAGCLLAGRLANVVRLAWVVGGGLAASGCAMLLLAVPLGEYGFYGAVALVGLMAGFVIVPLETALQRHVPDEIQGRVFSVNSLLLNTTLIAGILGAKQLSAALPGGLQTTIALQGALAVAGGAVALALIPAGARIATLHRPTQGMQLG